MTKLSNRIGQSWWIGSLMLSGLWLSGCGEPPTPSSATPFAMTTPENQPPRVRGDVEEDPLANDDSPRIPGFTTEKNRKEFLRTQFAYEEEGDPPPIIESPSGLKYRILEPGTGQQVEETSRITINYMAFHEDGHCYDSLLTGGKIGDIPEKMMTPVTYVVEERIKGWREGLVKLKEGGLIELDIPPELAYGPRGSKSVPPNARLFFFIRVLAVNPKMFVDQAREIIREEGFKKSDADIFYKIIKKTDGRRPGFTDIVTVNYTVHRTDGRMYIDTYESGEPLRRPVYLLIKGMSEGVKMLAEGGIIEMILPPEKGFGRHSQTDEVPDNVYVRVKMELLKIERNEKLGLPQKSTGTTNEEASGDAEVKAEEETKESPDTKDAEASDSDQKPEESGKEAEEEKK
ncbi:MAG: FKBP-type peptidyl-prolyl cis-trans isomerase [Planctomycetaceae bacterium]|nr:FKBP-type peptidyl-prolyl cis-trans isomerase [Planctomycetaceae bacterium]